MTEREKPDLSTIEPIGRVPDADDADADADAAERDADRVGRVGAAVANTPPAVGVEADADAPERAAEPRTSPETEEELDRLRRG
jgi:hypothetical protein